MLIKKVLLLLTLFIPCISALANTTIDIFYEDGGEIHYTCKYWCTRLSFNKHSPDFPDDGFAHIVDSAYVYGHIEQIEEDFDNLYKEIMKDHSYVVVAYKKNDGKIIENEETHIILDGINIVY